MIKKIFFLIFLTNICLLNLRAQNKEMVGDTIELQLDGYKSGKIQWQFSSNKQKWADIQGMSTQNLKYKISGSGYYRAKVENGCEVLSDTTYVRATNSVNTDTIPDVVYMYYKDRILISKLIPGFIPNNYVSSNADFIVKDDQLFLKNPNNLSKVYYEIELIDRTTNVRYPIKIKIRCWIKDKYILSPEIATTAPHFIYTYQDTTYTIDKGKLYYSARNSDKKVFCVNFPLIDPRYNEMVCKYGYYAIRTLGKIYVSTNLKDWELIYDDKRAIKESMVIVKNKNGCELLFTEYTAGWTNLVRHCLWSYNLKSKVMSVRKQFYTAEDLKTQGLSPSARHIHLLVQDPYSDMIFLNTGDSGVECATYFSNDQGLTFMKLGGGSQAWRSLNIFFNEDYVFWTMDSQYTQYIFRLKKSDLQENINEAKLTRYPLINSAIWCSQLITLDDGTPMYVISSDAEGTLYDNNFRNFGIVLVNNEPIVYELSSRKAKNWDYFWYPIGNDSQNNLLICDMETFKRYIYRVVAVP